MKTNLTLPFFRQSKNQKRAVIQHTLFTPLIALGSPV